MKIWLLLLILVTKVFAAKKNAEGPYRSVLLSVWRCQNTTYPLVKDPPIILNMWAINSGTSRYRLLSGNVTVVKDTKQVRVKVKRFTSKSGKWELAYSIKNTCHGVLLDLLCATMDFKIDTRKCTFLQGIYSMNGININTVQHTFASKMEYGEILWQSEMNAGFSTYHCWEFHTVVERV